MAGFIRKFGLDLGGVYATNDGREFHIMAMTPDECFIGVDYRDGSRRLFYEDGQYVGGGVDRDATRYSAQLRRASQPLAA